MMVFTARLAALSLLISASHALAQTPVEANTNFTSSPAYKECTSLAGSDPAAALVKAEEWLKIDNGVAAQHCRAMALFGLKRFSEAGDALASVRELIARDDMTLRSYVSRQAARAFVQASRADAALAILASQITDMGSIRGDNVAAAKLTAELLLDRARLNITYGKLREAVVDLDHAVSLTPTNEELLVTRAECFEQLGDGGLAHEDANAALKLKPGHTKAAELLKRLDAKAKPAAQ